MIRYRYYVSQALLQHREAGAFTRLAAAEIEGLVEHRVWALLKDQARLLDALGLDQSVSSDQHRLLMAAQRVANGQSQAKDRNAFLRSIIQRVTVAPGEISITLSRRTLKDHLLGNDQTDEPRRSDPAHVGPEDLLVLAHVESLPERYVSRVLRLAFLAPYIVEAILDGNQPPDLDLEQLLKGVPSCWDQ